MNGTSKRRSILCCLHVVLAFCVTAQPPNSACSTAQEIASIGGWCSGLAIFTNIGATPASQEAPCMSGSTADVWFTFVAEGTSLFIATSSNTDNQQGEGPGLTNFATTLYSGNCSALTSIDCQGTMQNGPAVHWIQDIRVGQRIFLQITSDADDAGNFGICINSFTPPPVNSSDSMDCGLLSLSTSEDLILEASQEIQLQAFHSPADRIVRYTWLKGDEIICTDCRNIKDIPSESTIYTASIEDSNGCKVEKRVSVAFATFGRKRFAYIPNAFSPNGDQINDFLTVYGDVTLTNISYLNIYDRQGRLIFRKEDFAPGQDQLGWDGTVHGELQMGGTFAYLTEVRYTDGASRRFFGSFHLIR